MDLSKREAPYLVCDTVPPSIEEDPNKVKVVFRCVFPIMSDPRQTAGCYVDYREFSKSMTGKCIIRCDNLPKGVISVSVEPEVAECVERL